MTKFGTRAGSGLLGGAQRLNQYLHERELSKGNDAAAVGKPHEGGSICGP